MERARQAFDLFYRSSCDVGLHGPSVLAEVWKEVEGTADKLAEYL